MIFPPANRMRLLAALVALAVSACAPETFAHICNNVYRSPDRLIVKPEKSITAVDKSEEIRVFMKNNFPVTINKVALTAKSDDDGVEVIVTPESVASLRPGEKVDFKLKIKVAPTARAGKHNISVGISAAEVGFESIEESPVEKLRQIVRTPGTNPSTQVMAAESLAKRGDSIGFDFLKEMAGNATKAYRSKSSTQDYRARATRALGRVGSETALPLLQEMALERDGYLRGCALIATAMVTALSSPKANLTDGDPLVKACGAAARTEKDMFVKTCAQAALTYRGEKSFLTSLTDALKDSDPYVRVAAAWGLGSVGKKEGVQALDEILNTSGKDVKLRMFVGEALISLPERAAAPAR